MLTQEIEVGSGENENAENITFRGIRVNSCGSSGAWNQIKSTHKNAQMHCYQRYSLIPALFLKFKSNQQKVKNTERTMFPWEFANSCGSSGAWNQIKSTQKRVKCNIPNDIRKFLRCSWNLNQIKRKNAERAMSRMICENSCTSSRD